MNKRDWVIQLKNIQGGPGSIVCCFATVNDSRDEAFEGHSESSHSVLRGDHVVKRYGP